MIDISILRNNSEIIKNSMEMRNVNIDIDHIINLDKEHRLAETTMQSIKAEQNKINKEIGIIRSKGGDYLPLMEKTKSIEKDFIDAQTKTENLSQELRAILESIPNILDPDVHYGKSDEDAKELKVYGNKKNFNFDPLEHFDIGEKMKNMDFITAAKISGSRFVILYNKLAKLERVLTDFMINEHCNQFGYTEVSIPLLVNSNALFGTGQLPKFEEDLFKTTDNRYLIPTGEVTLTNIAADRIINEEELPLRFTSYSQCFRSEAGSAGKDTRGMIRQHQFGKVELVSVVNPSESKNEHERMLSAVENILKKLDLPYRVVLLASGDTGFSSQKTYDIEVWFPGQKKYREISSCSNCGSFQARRMMSRVKYDNNGQKDYLHTLNGSGLAVGRTIAAILENYQNSDGSVIVPSVLNKYFSSNTL